MISPALPLQKAMFDTAGSDADLVAFFGAGGPRVYDRPPAKPKFPYVTIGDDQVLADDAEDLDGAEVFGRVHIWSRGVGVVEAKRLEVLIAKALDVELVIEGHAVIAHGVESIQTGAASDPLTTHRIVEFRYLTEPTS